MPEESASRLETLSKTAQVISVVAGGVISVLSFNETRQKEAAARFAESQDRKFALQKYYNERADKAKKDTIEAAKPFLEMRQKRYMEAIQAAGVRVSPDLHTAAEIQKARKRFWELYWAELSRIEAAEVEESMVKLGQALEPKPQSTPQQKPTYELAHALRNSLVKSWGIDERTVEQDNATKVSGE